MPAARPSDETPRSPHAFRRFARERARLAATAALVAAGLSIALLPGGIGAVLHDTAPAERPAYDLLVTALPGSEIDNDEADAGARGERAPEDVMAAATTSADAGTGALPPGLLPLATLSTDAARLDFDDLAAIRAVDGVDVAAPYGLVYASALGGFSTQLVADVDFSTSEPSPHAYRVTLRTWVDDGTGERLVAEDVLRLALDRSDAPSEWLVPVEELDPNWSCNIGEGPMTAEDPRSDACRTRYREYAYGEGDGMFASGTRIGDQIVFSIAGAPRAAEWIALVDPDAESELFGDDAAWLEPLGALPPAAGVDQLATWSAAREGPEAERVRRFAEEFWMGPAGADPMYVPPSFLPVLEVVGAEPAVRREAQIDELGPASIEEGYGGFSQFVLPPAADDAEAPTLANLDLPESSRPFAPPALPVPWPGSAPLSGAPPARSWTLAVTAPVQHVLPVVPVLPDGGADAGGRPRLEPLDYQRTVGSDIESPGFGSSSHAAAGASARYRGIDERRRPGVGAAGGFSSGTIAVGSVSREELRGVLPDAAPELVADPQGNPVDALPLGPSLTGLGIGDGAPTLVAPIDAFELGVVDPIHAVRVLVAGVDAYTPAGIRAVEAAAARLEAAGYRAVPVAGAGLRPLELDVEGYAFGDAGDERATTGALGTVREQWLQLGPAGVAALHDGRAPAPVTAASGTAIAAGVGAALLCFALVEAAAVGRRRREAAVHERLGWSRRRSARWFGAELLIPVAATIVAAQFALSLAGDRALGAVAANLLAAGVVAVAVASLAATLLDGRRFAPLRRIVRTIGDARLRIARIAGAASIAAGVAALALLAVEEARLAGGTWFAESVHDGVLLGRAVFPLLAILAGLGVLLAARPGRPAPAPLLRPAAPRPERPESAPARLPASAEPSAADPSPDERSPGEPSPAPAPAPEVPPKPPHDALPISLFQRPVETPEPPAAAPGGPGGP